MKMALTGTVARVVAEYTGRELTALDMHPDPKVPGTYALRATFNDEPSPLDFLVIGVAPNKLTPDDLEDADFEEWPPTSGKVRFFV